jgi:hypothetical protein
MNNIRAKFEEIWPVPEGLFWSPRDSGYIATNKATDLIIDAYNARLDTFTRCQETTKELLGIIEFMTNTLDDFIEIHEDEPNRPAVFQAVEITKRAKQIMEQKK